jgi:hypothetical protein
MCCRGNSLAASTQLGDLPEAEVAGILQHIPLQERLTCCALVCSSWAAAAAAAPADVDVKIDSNDERTKQLQNWLGKHGGVVTKLAVVGQLHTRPVLQLPVSKLTQLQSLRLCGIKTQLLGYVVPTRSSGRRKGGSALTGPSSSAAASSVGSAAAAVALPQLQELSLRHCDLTVPLACQLLSSNTLTSVQWHRVGLHKENQVKYQPQQLMLSMLWQQLQQLPKLSFLQLGGDLEAVDLNPVSALSSLQHLGVFMSRPTDAGAAAVAAAPAGLTALELQVEVCLVGRYLMDLPDTETEVCLSRLSSLLSLGGPDPHAVWLSGGHDRAARVAPG